MSFLGNMHIGSQRTVPESAMIGDDMFLDVDEKILFWGTKCMPIKEIPLNIYRGCDHNVMTVIFEYPGSCIKYKIVSHQSDLEMCEISTKHIMLFGVRQCINQVCSDIAKKVCRYGDDLVTNSGTIPNFFLSCKRLISIRSNKTETGECSHDWGCPVYIDKSDIWHGIDSEPRHIGKCVEVKAGTYTYLYCPDTNISYKYPVYWLNPDVVDVDVFEHVCCLYTNNGRRYKLGIDGTQEIIDPEEYVVPIWNNVKSARNV